MRPLRFYLMATFTILFSIILSSCSNQYAQSNTITETSAYPKALERAMKNKRYFMMQSGLNIYTVTSIDVHKGKQQITVTLDKPDSMHLAWFKNPGLRTTRTAEGKPAQREVHVFMKDSTSYTLDEPHTIPVNKVGRVELLD